MKWHRLGFEPDYLYFKNHQILESRQKDHDLSCRDHGIILTRKVRLASR